MYLIEIIKNTTIIIVVIIIFIFLGLSRITNLISKIIRNNKKSEITFDEFDDIEKIKQQEKKEKQEMEYEAKVLDEVYNDTFNENMNMDNDNVWKAINEAQKKVEEAKLHLYNFKILDSVEVEEDNIKEGVSISALRENGNNFDVELFKKWSRQIFGCIKLGTEEQLEVVKKFMTEELYNRLVYQTKQFERDGLEFITEDLLIEQCNVFDYSKGMSKEEIKILIKAKMKEYIMQKSNNQVIRGNKNKFYEKKIIMTFLKKNVEDEEGLATNCPNCGAEVSQTEFGKCRYCNTLIVPIRYNWTLTKFETI